MRALRVLLIALLLIALPLLAAGCIKPRDAQLSQGGQCDEVAYGFLRYNTAVSIDDVESRMRDLGFDTRRYVSPQGDTWLLFRPGIVGGNATYESFRGVVRVFNMTDPSQEGSLEENATAGNGTGRAQHTLVSFTYDPPANTRPFNVPLDAQQGQMAAFSNYLTTSVMPQTGLQRAPDTTFYDTKAVCLRSSDDDLEPDLTPEGDLAV